MLYTLWIKNFIGEVGKKCRINYPLRLQGGGEKNIRIGGGTIIQSYSVLGCWVKYGNDVINNPHIIIGRDCNFGEYTHITTINRISIGDGLLTGRFVYIGDHSHGGLSWEEATILPSRRQLVSKGEIVIGNNVWLGDKVTVLSGVTIGDNVIIGANSVVSHNIPSNCMAAGIPARVIKSLNDKCSNE